MRWKSLMLVAGATSLLTAASALRGGWAVLTVHELPESLVAGETASLTFSMRQHGIEMLRGRSPSLQLRSGGLLGGRQRVVAERTDRPGVYRATFTVPETESLRLRVDGDFNGWTVDLLPVAVRGSGAARPASNDASVLQDRGRALFVAKGCIGCHVKQDDPALSDYQKMHEAPELTGRGYPTDWLVQKITNPASVRDGQRVAGFAMPRLEVSVAEAQAIAGYINARALASRE